MEKLDGSSVGRGDHRAAAEFEPDPITGTHDAERGPASTRKPTLDCLGAAQDAVEIKPPENGKVVAHGMMGFYAPGSARESATEYARVE